MNTGHLFGLARVYGQDARMGVGAAQDLSVQHAGQVDIAGVNGLACDLVDTVVTNRSSADDLVLRNGRFRTWRRGAHDTVSFICSAAA